MASTSQLRHPNTAQLLHMQRLTLNKFLLSALPPTLVGCEGKLSCKTFVQGIGRIGTVTGREDFIHLFLLPERCLHGGEGDSIFLRSTEIDL